MNTKYEIQNTKYGIRIIDLGIVAYEYAIKVQDELVGKRINNEVSDTLIILEHTPVVTLGRISEESAIFNPSYFEGNAIPVIRSGRGGKNTYHSPGQLVLYPVIDLSDKKKDISFYIDFLERTVSRALNKFGIPIDNDPGRRGVWTGGKKIAFIGIAVKRWVTYHGLSININNDTEPFSHMYPCGESDIKVISAKEILGRELDMDRAKKVFAEQFVGDLGAEYPGV